MGTSAGRRRCGCSACSGSSPTARRYALVFGDLLRGHGADPVRRPGARRAPADPRRAVRRPADRGLGGAPLPRAAAARGPRRRAAGLRPLAAHQPAAGDLRPAVRARELYGIVGALVALPLAAIARETVVYLRRHLVLEPWGTVPPTALAAGPAPGIPPPVCAECGDVRPDDAFCRSCGAALEPRSRRLASLSAWPRRPLRAARRARLRSASARARRCAGSASSAQRGELLAVIGPNGAGKTTLLSILAGIRSSRRRRASSCRRARSAGSRSSPPSTRSSRSRRTCGCSRGWRRSTDAEAAVARMLEQTGLADRADDELGQLSGGNRQRVNIAIGLLADPPVLLLDEPSSALDPRQRERAVGVRRRAHGRGGTTIVFSTHDVAEAERHADRVLVLADGELLFTGTPARAGGRAGGRRRRTSRRRSCASCTSGATEDALAARSRTCGSCGARRCSSALLVAYPVLVALLIGLRAVRRPGQAEGGVRQPGAAEREHVQRSAARRSTRARYADELFDSVDPIRVDSREEALDKVEVRRGARRPDRPARHRREAAGTRLSAPSRSRSRSSTTARTRSRAASSSRRSSRGSPTPTRRCRRRSREIAVERHQPAARRRRVQPARARARLLGLRKTERRSSRRRCGRCPATRRSAPALEQRRALRQPRGRQPRPGRRRRSASVAEPVKVEADAARRASARRSTRSPSRSP